MAYRTYRNLYRIRPSLTSIGQGRHRIRLPRGMNITIDVGILTILFWLPFNYTIGFVASLMFPLLPYWVNGFILSAVVSYQLGKKDPAGKTTLRFIIDLVLFLFRNKTSDGFESRPKVRKRRETINWSINVALMDDGRIGSIPTKGHVKQFELLVPAAVRVLKDGEVHIQRKGKSVQPGWYEVSKNGVTAKREPPKLGLKRKQI